MCAVFGFLDYKGKISNAVLKRLIPVSYTHLTLPTIA